jgi:hypothetical protein
MLATLATFISSEFVVPPVGLISFVVFDRWMRRSKIQSPPVFPYLILFPVIGGWLMIAITALSGRWGGIASLTVATWCCSRPSSPPVQPFDCAQITTLRGFIRPHSWRVLPTVG